MRKLFFVLMLLCSCSEPKPIERYTSEIVWFAKFQNSHGASNPMKQVANAKGMFTIKRYEKTFEVTRGSSILNLTIDSIKKYANSTRFFLKDRESKLYQISIYVDSLQLQKGTARIELTSWSTPHYSKFMDWNPTYIYAIEAKKQ